MKLHAFGYQVVDRGGFSWLANELGLRFICEVDDWSPETLVTRKGWSFWDKGSHALYVAQDYGQVRFLVKVYRARKSSAAFLTRQVNKAKQEFYNTLYAYEKGFNTVLPLALGESSWDRSSGVIVYPFLDNAIPLDKVYPYRGCGGLAIFERQYLEKSVGRLLRKCFESGIFPANMCLGHFLARKEAGGRLVVYWVDFEKLKFRSLRRKRFGVKSLGKLLARIEWFRVSGGRINRSSIMRVGHACFHKEGSGKLDKKLCRAIIQAAKEYWEFRKIDTRGLYPLGSVQPVDQVTH